MSSPSPSVKQPPRERWIGSVVFGSVAAGLFLWSGQSVIAQIAFVTLVFGRLFYVIYVAWRDSNTASRTLSPQSRAYSIPRKFSLGILFLVTLAAALLSAGLNSLQLPPQVVMIALGFMGLVALSQVFFDRTPRHASMIVGSLVFPLFLISWPDIIRGILSLQTEAFFWLAVWSLIGAAAGYGMGTFMGGVLLIADKIYLLTIRPKLPQSQKPTSSSG